MWQSSIFLLVLVPVVASAPRYGEQRRLNDEPGSCCRLRVVHWIDTNDYFKPEICPATVRFEPLRTENVPPAGTEEQKGDDKEHFQDMTTL